jgi:hypothetical protein
MDTYEPGEDNSNWSPTLHDGRTFEPIMGSEDEFKITEIRKLIFTSTVCALAIMVAFLFCCCMVNRCRNSGKTTTRRRRSEKCELYQNATIIRDGLAGDSLETIVNRPLPHPPDKNRQSAESPAIPEDDYLRPIPVDAFWHRHKEEIRQLPPAPPVFPGQLGRLLLDGEGTYIPVIPDDEAPLLSPRPMHEIAHNQELCEYSEESGYEVPISPTWTSLQKNVTETDHFQVPRKVKHKGNEYKVTARAVVTSHGAEKQCSNTSKRRSLSESASVSSDTRSETEKSDDTKGKIYRSACQLYLSPPTQKRKPPVPTRKPTVVVCIHAEL